MAKNTLSFVDMFFNYSDANNWVEDRLYDHLYTGENMEPSFEWKLIALEIKLMDSGGFRAGVTFEKSQLELFGSTEDA